MTNRDASSWAASPEPNPWLGQGPQPRRCYASELLLRAEAAREREQAAEMRASG